MSVNRDQLCPQLRNLVSIRLLFRGKCMNFLLKKLPRLWGEKKSAHFDAQNKASKNPEKKSYQSAKFAANTERDRRRASRRKVSRNYAARIGSPDLMSKNVADVRQCLLLESWLLYYVITLKEA